MNKFSLIALGAVSAHYHHKHHQVNNFDHMLDAPKYCGLKKEDEATTLETLRQLTQVSIREFTRGHYQETVEIVSDDCFGTWMIDSYN